VFGVGLGTATIFAQDEGGRPRKVDRRGTSSSTAFTDREAPDANHDGVIDARGDRNASPS